MSSMWNFVCLVLQLIDFDGQIFMCNGRFHSLQAHADKFEQIDAALQTWHAYTYICMYVYASKSKNKLRIMLSLFVSVCVQLYVCVFFGKNN